MEQALIPVPYNPYYDNTGEERRCGTHTVPAGFVSAFKTYEAEHPVMDDADIRKIIDDSQRTPSRVIFDLTWIQNQRSKGSCNGYAGAACVAKANYLRGFPKALLSGAYVYSKINDGRDQGSILERGMQAIQTFGVPLELTVPWDQIYPDMQIKAADEEAAKRKGFLAYAVQTQQGLKTALALRFPCVIVVHASRDFEKLNANGIAGVSNGVGNHAIHADDLLYRNGEFLFDAVNSWSTTYGEKGRAYVRWASFEQTFPHHQFYAVPTTSAAEG